MKKICLNCNAEFETGRHKSSKFCSHSCANKYTAKSRERNVSLICKYCGKQFNVNPGDLRYRKVIKYCSIECRNKGAVDHSKHVLVKCDNCGKEIYKLKSRVNKTKHNYCDIKCKNESFSKHHPSRNKDWGNLISESMNNKSVKNKLSKLNSRKRSKMTEDHKNKISDKLVGIMPKNATDNRFSKYKRGTYNINGKDIFFRSKWEANYALYLDFLIKQGHILKWEYEPQTFYFLKIKRGCRSYKPDFKVYNKTGYEWHEVKGYMDSKSKTKLNRMRIYYPNETIKIIDKKIYYDIINKLGGVLKIF